MKVVSGQRTPTPRKIAASAFFLAAAVGCVPEGEEAATDDCPTRAPIQRLAIDGAIPDGFGLDGQTLWIGDRLGRRVVAFDVTTGLDAATIEDPTGLELTSFGQALDVDSARIAVGAPSDNALQDIVPAVHIFDADSGSLLQSILSPTPTEKDLFGAAVALDGDRLLVGAPGGDRAYLFSATSGTLLLEVAAPATSTDGSRFGAAVDIDGDRFLVGAPDLSDGGEFAGGAFLYQSSDGTPVSSVSPVGLAPGDRLGAAVALVDGVGLVGAPGRPRRHRRARPTCSTPPTARSRRSSRPPSPWPTLASVRPSPSELTALVGAGGNNGTTFTESGSVHRFDAGTGALLMSYVDDGPDNFETFGRAIAIDGNLMAIRQANTVYRAGYEEVISVRLVTCE